MTYVRLETISGTVSKTATGVCVVPNGINALCLNLRGTLIARTGLQGKLVLIPPRSITYIRNTRLIVQCARGEHFSQLLSWPTVVTNLMEKWMQDRTTGKNQNSPARVVACKPIDPHFKDAVERFNKAVSGPAEIVEPLVVSFLYEAGARLMSSLDQVQLAATPLDVPDTVKDLIAKVRENPALPWPLKDAADMAGYSPFHFSRVFKGLVGYGFHEYVDRCRTECAVELLVTTDMPVDLVASTCGFGTTQGLRESVKEYLGLVPSELRAVPDSLDLVD
jgi:AraC-like DNA-binding protein